MKPSRLIRIAIEKEIEAYELYTNVARRTDNPAAKALLQELAAEEDKHRALLEGLKPEQVQSFKPPRLRDLQITEYLSAKPLGPDSGLQDVLIHAMKREQRAREFYEAMGGATQDAALRTLLEKLATMEKSHKARLEALYEEVFMREM